MGGATLTSSDWTDTNITLLFRAELSQQHAPDPEGWSTLAPPCPPALSVLFIPLRQLTALGATTHVGRLACIAHAALCADMHTVWHGVLTCARVCTCVHVTRVRYTPGSGSSLFTCTRVNLGKQYRCTVLGCNSPLHACMPTANQPQSHPCLTSRHDGIPRRQGHYPCGASACACVRTHDACGRWCMCVRP